MVPSNKRNRFAMKNVEAREAHSTVYKVDRMVNRAAFVLAVIIAILEIFFNVSDIMSSNTESEVATAESVAPITCKQ
jgi:hypothetical protein